jgi:hypothetical protein
LGSTQQKSVVHPALSQTLNGSVAT